MTERRLPEPERAAGARPTPVSAPVSDYVPPAGVTFRCGRCGSLLALRPAPPTHYAAAWAEAWAVARRTGWGRAGPAEALRVCPDCNPDRGDLPSGGDDAGGA